MFVDILINLPVAKINQQEYTYRVPEDMEPDAVVGKRALVELGRRRIEGFITATGVKEIADARPIIKILDEEPVFDHQLLELARWMADYYLCPLSIVLNAMIPPRLGKSGSKRLLALISQEEAREQRLLWDEIGSNPILQDLWQNGELDYRQVARKYSVPELEELEERGLVLITGVYSGYRPVPETCIYRINTFDPSQQMESLKKKAPAQARFMEALLRVGSLDSRQARELVSRSSIEALLKKGYIVKNDPRETALPSAPEPELNREQKEALQKVCLGISKGRYDEYLLHGVTGSGKTEVYIRAAQEAIRQGKQALVLVPEIALSRHLINVFSSRISRTVVLHSRMPGGARLETWKKVRRGEVDLVLGTRSAVFAPLPRLGLVVIDEEQENSFKQEEQPRYHAREVAEYRAKQDKAVLLMGSATPSLETFYRAAQAPDHLLSLPHRIGGSSLPVVRVVDMRKNSPPGSGVLSPLLQEKLQSILAKGEQAILVLNRRGFTTMSVCRKCGAVARCPHCSVALTYHRASGKDICHYCDYRTEPLSVCPDCGSPALQQLGAGTQKLEEEVKRLFPAARLERMDLDNSRRQGFQARVIKAMEEGNIDILIGTQMVARGLHFPRVSLVGILNVDQMLNLPDFRAGEKAFQFIVQAAGRAGRGAWPGEVILQTFNPGNTVIEMAANLDFMGFYREELKLRRLLQYPPFTHILRVVVSSPQEDLARKAANMIRLEINDIIDAREEEITILGPAPCPLARLKDRFRYQLMVKYNGLLLLNSIGHFLQSRQAHYKARMELDINPATTM